MQSEIPFNSNRVPTALFGRTTTGDLTEPSSTILKYVRGLVSYDLSLDHDDCSKHTLVSHVAVLHHNSALLVKYREMPDGQKGWFLPNDGLKHVEHPEEGAKRILREQVGIEPSTLKLAQIESFVGNNKSWHLIFDFLAFPLSMKITMAPNLLDAQWFEIDKLPPASEFAHHGWGHSSLQKLVKIQS